MKGMNTTLARTAMVLSITCILLFLLPADNPAAFTQANSSSIHLIAKIRTGNDPIFSVFDPANNEVYVLGKSEVFAISSANNTIVARIHISQAEPSNDAISYDPSNANIYVSSLYGGANDSGTVTVLSSSKNKIVATVSVPFPTWINYDPADGNMYVAGATNISVISSSTNKIVKSVNIGCTSDCVLGIVVFDSPNGDLYVPDAFHNTVSVISGSNDSLVKKIKVGSEPISAMYDLKDNDIYVANYASNSISVISGKTNDVIATLKVGSNPGSYPNSMIYDPFNDNIYVPNQNSNSVSVISGSNIKVIATVGVGLSTFTVSSITLDLKNKDLYVSTGYFSVISGSSSKVIAVIKGISSLQATYDPANFDVYADISTVSMGVLSS